MNNKMDFDDILIEWGYRVHNGQPNPKDTNHLYHLSQILYENGWPYQVVEGLIQNLLEQETKFKGRTKDGQLRYYKTKDALDKALEKGTVEPVEEPDKKKDEPKSDKVDKPSDFDRDTKQNKDIDPDYTRDSGDVSQDTKVALEKLNDKRFGVAAKTETSLRKGYIGQADADNMEQFQSEMGDFLREPTKEKAEALVEKYKLSQNPNGKKLYIGIIAGNGRKILGEGNALVNELSKVLNDYVPLKEKGDVQRTAQNKLQSASKPELKTVRKSDDPGVKKLFSNPPYNRLKERFHQVFGPVGEDGNLLRPSSEHSAAYFKQSVDENSSLDKTIEALKELEQQGSASPEVRKALEDHKKRMNEISKNFDTMSQEERQKQVEQSYSDMARDMHRADPDIARGLMKNMAEMALYDTELAAGDEVYLPSDGQFPSADKMRVDRDGKGVVEKVAGVSVKFGKNGGVYGFPGESAQYQKFHPDEDKRTYMRNRVGHKGHALGVRDDLVDDKDKFDKMIDESGLSKAIKNSEVVRTKLSEISKQIDEARSKIEDENGKYSIKDLVSIRKELEDLNSQMKSVLEENIDVKELENIMGRANAREFMKGASQSINIISMASVLNTSDGLSVLEHNHQTIDKDGLRSETDKGTPNLKDWNFQFRAFDSRGGGLLCGFVGGDSPPGEI